MSDLSKMRGSEEDLDILISEDKNVGNLKEVVNLIVTNADQAIAIGAEISQRMAECRILDKNKDNDDEELAELFNTLKKLRELIEERFRNLF